MSGPCIASQGPSLSSGPTFQDFEGVLSVLNSLFFKHQTMQELVGSCIATKGQPCLVNQHFGIPIVCVNFQTPLFPETKTLKTWYGPYPGTTPVYLTNMQELEGVFPFSAVYFKHMKLLRKCLARVWLFMGHPCLLNQHSRISIACFPFQTSEFKHIELLRKSLARV